MKKRFFLIMAGLLVLCCCACGGPDEVPPRKVNVNTEFIIPQLSPLTGAEWDIIDAKKAEYEDAIKKH